MEELVEIRHNRIINILQHDNGLPHTLFFIHGAGGSLTHWSNQIEYFKDKYNIVAIDLLGHGKSQQPQSTKQKNLYTFDELAADIQAVFNRYQTSKNYILGHSYGGVFASYLAINNQSKIEKLILVAPLAFPIVPFRARLLQLPSVLIGIYQQYLLKYFIKFGFSANIGQEIISNELARLQAISIPVMKSLIAGIYKVPNIDLSQIKIPTLAILSKKDTLIKAKDILNYYKKINNIRFIEVNNSNHVIILEQPEKINQLIEKFI